MLIHHAGLVIYEYVISFDQEIMHVWTRKLTATSFLLLSTRWVMVLIQILDLVPSGPSKCKSLSCMMQTDSRIPFYRSVTLKSFQMY